MKKILVIEDEYSIRESILDLLEAEGFKVVVAENGSIGVKQAQEQLPDLILCDVTMPKLDGYGVLQQLRQNPITATIPFIFLTARGAKEDFRQGMDLGADDYLTKPCSAEELISAINSRFRKHDQLISQSQQQLDTLRQNIALSLPHELRTPLNGILGLSELLMDDHEQIDRKEIYEISEGIYKAADRLHRLIQNFLLYVELELTTKDSDRIRVMRNAKTQFPKALIGSTATQIARHAGRTTDLSLDLHNAPIQVADLKLNKIVEELTDNAFKFSKPNTPVQLTATVDDRFMTLSVSDQGRGMTPEQIASMGAYMQFERKFYEQQGSGLGLAIAKRLVELHNGEFKIISTPGKGTTVQLSLPIAVE